MDRPLKILAIGHSYVIASNRATLRHIAGTGDFEITVAAPRFFHGDLRPCALEPEPEGSSIKLVSIGAYFTRFIHLFWYGHRQLKSLIQENEFDVIHIWEEPYIFSGYQIATLAHRAGAKIVIRSAQSLHKRYPFPFNYFEKSVVSKIDTWIAGGKLVYENLLSRRYPKTKGKVITLAVDTQIFCPIGNSKKSEILGAIGLQGPVIGFLGRLTNDKGVLFLLKVLEKIPEDAGLWNVLFMGSGPEKNTIEKWAKAHHLSHRVKVKLLHHDEVPRFLPAMDILVAPSQTRKNWKEQFGRMLVEAFAAGVPVIASDSGEIPNVVADSGIIVNENDETGWVNAIVSLLKNPNLRREYSFKGLERAKSFSVEKVAEKWREFYIKLVNDQLSFFLGEQESNLDRPLKILAIGHSYVIASNRATLRQIAGTGDFEITVAAPRFFHGDLRLCALEPEPDSSNIKLVSIGAYFTRFIHVFWYGHRQLKSLIAENEFDVIHIWEEPYIFSGYQIATLAHRAGAKVCFFTFQNIMKNYPFPFNMFENRVVRAADGWVAATKSIYASMLVRRGYSATRGIAIPVGVNIKAFKLFSELEKTNAMNEIGLQGPVIGFLGRLTDDKGVLFLLKVLEKIPEDAGLWNALFMGSGPEKNTIEKWAEAHHLSHRVKVKLLHHDEVPRFLPAMDILVAPSQTRKNWKEQFGRMLVEAFAAGVPVIASDSGEIPIVVSDSGIIVNENDEMGWVNAIVSLLKNPNLRREYSLKGLERAKSFSVEKVAEEWREFYIKLVNR